ncbi:MAG: TonB family protein [Candidatus Sulfotelmatobacter sp.]|jgi:TonB family protein
MAYQALLFCPDEKTARTVTQVLSELDFTVTPCTEPFGAVKKLMAEHFDAVVVDCDNEQNATLVFKSARNTADNATSLAVAVVEGQAGVAKAFRIGANLVLTKPINVEQAKGTLRVARGLLRKNESAKPATPGANSALRPVVAPAAPKLVPQRPPAVSTARPATPIAPLASAAKAGVPIQQPAPRPSVVASIPTPITETEPESLPAADEEVAEPVIATPAAPVAKVIPAASSMATAEPKIAPVASQPVSVARVGSSAASAPAPAREKEAIVASEEKQSTVVAETENVVGAGDNSGSSQVEEGSVPSTSFTFGGNVTTGSGKKKTLLAVVVALLIAAVGYAVWMQWQLSEGYAVTPLHVASQPARIPAAAPKVAPSPAPIAPAPDASSTTSPTPHAAAVPQPSEAPDNSSDSDTETKPTEEKPKASPNKIGTTSATAKAKPATSASAANKTATEKSSATAAGPQPIVIKTHSSQPVAKPAETADTPAPSMAGIAPVGAGLPALVGGDSKAPTPVLQALHVSQGVSQGLLVKRTPPSYPASALQMHVEGAVELLATISKGGDISAVKIVSGDPQLARAAADAVKQWKYKPYLLNGEPVEIQTQVTVNFKLPN